MTIGKPGDIEVLAAGAADRSVFKNLIQLYLYDMASETRFPLGEDGPMTTDFWISSGNIPILSGLRARSPDLLR